jgi:hypothetical protein
VVAAGSLGWGEELTTNISPPSLGQEFFILRNRFGFRTPVVTLSMPPNKKPSGNRNWERTTMERRAVLAAAAVASAGLLSIRASADDALPEEVGAALARFHSIPSNFERDYVEHVVVPFFLTSIYEGERPSFPMIDTTLRSRMRFRTIFGG